MHRRGGVEVHPATFVLVSLYMFGGRVGACISLTLTSFGADPSRILWSSPGCCVYCDDIVVLRYPSLSPPSCLHVPFQFTTCYCRSAWTHNALRPPCLCVRFLFALSPSSFALGVSVQRRPPPVLLPQLFRAARAEASDQLLQELLQTVVDKCFTKCITKPSSSLTGGESACLAKCMDRFLEARTIVVKALENQQ
eukprot:TRINITY_DN4318_c0_g1_i2.p1 TRINITY_DN4318_c0_g1~~TRINITY_DN4318_c0_g1_i2.p1  ORF type:complete len:195 (-),score=32.79 TRINITY_DN4318_c0_g1_i2:225-809(-)